jgi:tRNA(His) 5'-end guanylyltransferase
MFSMALGYHAAFDCRISELPDASLVVDYFRWRHEDAHRNALNSHCYWLLRKEGKSAIEATKFLSGKSVAFKNEFLFTEGINFNNLPNWQKRGVGVSWEKYAKDGTNPVTGENAVAMRQRLKADYELPMGDEYDTYIRNHMANI